MSDAGVRGLTLAVLATLGLYSASRLEITHSIAHFLPSGDESALVEISLALVDSPLTRRMVLAVSGGPERVRVAAELAAELRSHPEVAWVEAGFDEEALRALYGLYFDRRVYLASDMPAVEIPDMLEPEALARRSARLRSRLAQPSSLLATQTAPADPLGIFDEILERIRAGLPPASAVEGGLASADGNYAIILLGLRSSPLDSGAQSQLLLEIEETFRALGGDLVLEQSGVNRIAVATERSIKNDVNFISAMALTGVCTLFLLVFRSLRHLFVALLIPLAGFAAAIAVELTLSPPLHGITLGFGFALIGVAIDYPIHVMNHHALSPIPEHPRSTVARIRASLLLSGLTTTLGFVALALSDFPGLEEMGTFAAVGVPVALCATMLGLPSFLRPGDGPTPVQRGLSRGFERLVRWLAKRRAVAACVPAVFAIIVAFGLPQIQWEDDPSTLMAADPALLAEDERVRRLIVDIDGGRFVLGLADDVESALRLNDRIHASLRDAVAANHLDGVRSLHSFLWSQQLQRENLAAFRSLPDLDQRIARVFSESGFRPGVFASFAEAVTSPAAAPLRPQDLVGSPLERALDSMVRVDQGWTVVTYLRGVRSGEGIQRSLDGLDGAYYVDQREIVGEVYEGYRRSTLRMMALGAAAVFLILQLRYRAPRTGLLAFLPSALVGLTTLALFGLLGMPVNVVSAISLVIVLGMGVDYGIFTVDGASRRGSVGPTLSSLLVSCLTTLFVFGALALSEQPALRSIGLTTGTGILLAMLLSPAIFVLASRDEPG